jgi:hypothetical protein
MGEQSPRKRGNPKWQPGVSGNPRGRPRTGLAFAERVRERVDPDVLIDLAVGIATDPNGNARDRLAAAAFLHGTAYQKPAERHEVAAVAAEPEDDCSWMSLEDLETIERIQAKRPAALPAADGEGDDDRG